MTKRIRITRRGIFRSGTDMIPVGTEMDVPDDFSGWNGKWELVAEGKGKTMEVATPEPDHQAGNVTLEDASAESEDYDLRAEYEQVVGRRPGPRMKPETMRRHIAEASTDD